MFQRLFQICLVVWISPTLLGKTTMATKLRLDSQCHKIQCTFLNCFKWFQIREFFWQSMCTFATWAPCALFIQI